MRFVGLSLVLALAACTPSGAAADPPKTLPHGTTVTTVKPSRQDLTNRVSLSGKVELSPVFGLVAPVAGQVRYVDVKTPTGTPTKPTRVAGVWASGKPSYVEVPAGATFAGRLVDDRSTVTAGEPIISARYAGYGIVADIDSGRAYQIADSVGSVQAQVKNGPGPFPCTVLGTIAALPPGTIPAPPPPAPAPSADPAKPVAPVPAPGTQGGDGNPSDATGMRLVCTAPAGTRLINGASATLDVVTQTVTGALVLPVEAVAGIQGKGKVDVVRADGTRDTRDVVLGLTDGKVVQIVSGLTGDETVAVPGPNLPAAPGNGNDKGGPTDFPGPK
jgi:hypothetical protein